MKELKVSKTQMYKCRLLFIYLRQDWINYDLFNISDAKTNCIRGGCIYNGELKHWKIFLYQFV